MKRKVVLQRISDIGWANTGKDRMQLVSPRLYAQTPSERRALCQFPLWIWCNFPNPLHLTTYYSIISRVWNVRRMDVERNISLQLSSGRTTAGLDFRSHFQIDPWDGPNEMGCYNASLIAAPFPVAGLSVHCLRDKVLIILPLRLLANGCCLSCSYIKMGLTHSDFTGIATLTDFLSDPEQFVYGCTLEIVYNEH